MKCRKCGSDNLSIQQVAITKTKGRTWKYWAFGGWLIDAIIFVFIGLLLPLIRLFKKKKVTTKIKKMATCQNCGNSWRVRF